MRRKIFLFLLVGLLALKTVVAKAFADNVAGDSYSCLSDNDCIIALLPSCKKGGCSPPCGHVYNTVPGALNKKNARNIIEKVRKQEESICGQIECIECEGIPLKEPDISNYKAVCQKSRCVLAAEDTATIKITYEDRQCIGNNGLNPEIVKVSLKKGNIKVFKIRIPKKIDVPACEACYPACSIRYEYEIDVKKNEQELANKIINELRIELPSRTQ